MCAEKGKTKRQPMKKERLLNVDFIRAICAIGIICFHFSVHSSSGIRLFIEFANGGVGKLLVTVFFILSGSMLYLNDREIPSLRRFYFKRWKALFPAFYIAWTFFFLENVHHTGSFFYLKGTASPASLLLTLTGLDGYFIYAIPNYYILGEWFLGAIVLLYLIYPLLLYGMNKYPLQTAVLVSAGFIWVACWNRFQIDPNRNLLSCLFSFYLGALLCRHRRFLESRWTGIISTAAAVFLLLVPLPFINQLILIHIVGAAVYMSLYWIGKGVVSVRVGKLFSEKIGALSYPVFLLQHQVILRVLARRDPQSQAGYTAVLLLTICITVAAAWLLQFVTKKMTRSGAFQDLERHLFPDDKSLTVRESSDAYPQEEK